MNPDGHEASSTTAYVPAPKCRPPAFRLLSFLRPPSPRLSPSQSRATVPVPRHRSCGEYSGRENYNGVDLNRNFPDQFTGDPVRPLQPETKVRSNGAAVTVVVMYGGLCCCAAPLTRLFSRVLHRLSWPGLKASRLYSPPTCTAEVWWPGAFPLRALVRCRFNRLTAFALPLASIFPFSLIPPPPPQLPI